VLHFIDRRALFGLGIGYVDAHLLAAVRLTAGAKLWTRDRRLQAVATQLGLAAEWGYAAGGHPHSPCCAPGLHCGRGEGPIVSAMGRGEGKASD
jgi:hypothetical protein